MDEATTQLSANTKPLKMPGYIARKPRPAGAVRMQGRELERQAGKCGRAVRPQGERQNPAENQKEEEGVADKARCFPRPGKDSFPGNDPTFPARLGQLDRDGHGDAGPGKGHRKNDSVLRVRRWDRRSATSRAH